MKHYLVDRVSDTRRLLQSRSRPFWLSVLCASSLLTLGAVVVSPSAHIDSQILEKQKQDIRAQPGPGMSSYSAEAALGHSRTSFDAAQGPQAGFGEKRMMRMLVTAYCPCTLCCGPNAAGKTSTGKDAYRHEGVAADPTAIPYGTRLTIPTVGSRVVDDTGAAMRRSWRSQRIYHLDLRFKSHEEARRWGRKWLDVEILVAR